MTFSFEVFPPKADQSMDPLLRTLDKLYDFGPDFVSCTYGAGGTNKGRSLQICEAIKRSGHEPLTHFTCIGNSRDDVRAIIGDYASRGIENLLLLRGDFPPGQTGTNGDFAHADALITYVRETFPGLCIAAAGYPEKHILAPSFDADIAHLRAKQDNGAGFIMLQLCHDLAAYEAFVRRVRRAEITLPIVVGIMPVLSRDPIIRMTVSNGCSIPRELAAILGRYPGPESAADFTKAGIEYTVAQIHRFIAAGIDGLHIFTLNKWEAVTEILNASGIKPARAAA